MSEKKIFLVLIIASLIYIAVFFSLKVYQYKSFFSFEWEDDAGVNQLTYNIAEFFSPYQTIFNTRDLSLLNDHFSPIVFIIALFYAIFPHIYMLYLFISLTYGFSSIIIYLLAKDILGSSIVAFFISLIYLMYPPLHYVNLGAIDVKNFALPLFLGIFYFIRKGKLIYYIILIISACMLIEDVPLVIFTLGIYLFLKKYPKKWWLTTILFSGIYFIVAVYIANTFCRIKGFKSIPAAGYLDYIDISTFKEFISYATSHMKETFFYLFGWTKIRVFIMLLWPLVFIPLFSSAIWIPVTTFIEILLRKMLFSNANSYHLAIIIPFIFISFIFVLQKLTAYINKRIMSLIALSILFVCFIANFSRNLIGCTSKESRFFNEPYADEYDRRFIGVDNIFDKRLYTIEEEDRQAWRMIKIIPKDASVMASGDLLLALSMRKIIYEFALNLEKAQFHKFAFSEYSNYDVDYILINKKCLINGMGGHYAFLPAHLLNDEIQRIIKFYNFDIQIQLGNFVLLKNKRLVRQNK